LSLNTAARISQIACEDCLSMIIAIALTIEIWHCFANYGAIRV